jgi:hypothetical protein
MRSVPPNWTAFLLATLLAGCGPEHAISDPPVLEPVEGVVTLNGEPLVGAVVTFLNLDERGTLTVGETDSEGFFKLQYLGAKGTAAGPYRVAVSYLMSTAGDVIGLARRSTNSPTAELNTAKELLPPRYSELGRTTLKADVPIGGGSFRFELEGALLDPPQPTAVTEPGADAAGSEKKGL